VLRAIIRAAIPATAIEPRMWTSVAPVRDVRAGSGAEARARSRIASAAIAKSAGGITSAGMSSALNALLIGPKKPASSGTGPCTNVGTVATTPLAPPAGEPARTPGTTAARSAFGAGRTRFEGFCLDRFEPVGCPLTWYTELAAPPRRPGATDGGAGAVAGESSTGASIGGGEAGGGGSGGGSCTFGGTVTTGGAGTGTGGGGSGTVTVGRLRVVGGGGGRALGALPAQAPPTPSATITGRTTEKPRRGINPITEIDT
jgi:hypothetical protein